MGTVAAGGSALLSSGALSDVESQRTVRAETVGDESAYLGLTYPEINVCAGQVTLVMITNQSKEPLTGFAIDDISVDGATIENIQTPDPLAVGESGGVTADAECAGTETATVTFTVEATGSETDVRAEGRSNDINCNC